MRRATPIFLAAAVAVAIAAGTAPLANAGSPPGGSFAQDFSLLDPAVPAPPGVFQDMDGNPVRLSDFEGGVVLLNFWATWCAPCVQEMPSLDRLQALLGPEGLTVAAVSIDRGGRSTVATFAEKHGLRNINLFLDPKSALARAFALSGLPATFLIDADGQVLRGLAGAAEWDSPEAVALIRHYLDNGDGGEPDIQNASAAGLTQ